MNTPCRLAGGKLIRSTSSPDIFKESLKEVVLNYAKHETPKVTRVRRFYMEEVFEDGLEKPKLLKHFSCEEIFNACEYKTGNLNYCQNTSSKPNIPAIDWEYPSLGQLNINSNLEIDISPMEVDEPFVIDDVHLDKYTINNTSTMQNTVGSDMTRQRNIRKCCFTNNDVVDGNLSDKDSKSRNHKTKSKLSHVKQVQKLTVISKFLFILGVIISMLLLYVIFVGDFFIINNREVQVLNLKRDLTEKVHEQSSVRIVSKSLEQIGSWQDKLKVLVFVGPSGVGKTFVSKIVKSHFYYRLVHEISGADINSLELQKSLVKKFYSCCCNLLVVEDLRAENTKSLINFIRFLPKDYTIFAITIFNIQDVDNNLSYHIHPKTVVNIRDDFENSNIYYEMVHFNHFNETSARDWLYKLLNNEKADQKFHDDIIKNVLQNHKLKDHGLKGLAQKVLIELNKLPNV